MSPPPPDETAPPVLAFEDVVKEYQGLRPLRVAALQVRAGERVAISGLDATAAEVFVNLVNGALLPDRGGVRVFGKSTAEIADEEEWLRSLDRFGIVTDRAVLLPASSVAQNVALPLTLEIDPLPPAIRDRVEDLARATGLTGQLERPAAGIDAPVRLRVHLARALALGPELLLLEHPTAALSGTEAREFARTLEAAARARDLTMVALTDDGAFADIVADRTLSLKPGTGELVPEGRWRRWLRR